MLARREKTFGPGRAVPQNAASLPTPAPGPPGTASPASTRGRSPAPSWRSCRRCYGASITVATAAASPSYERIAEKSECARSTVAEALKALEWAGVLTWQHRITRVRERCTDLFGNITWQWRVHRRSNAYAFRDPQQRASVYQSENASGTQNQSLIGSVPAPARDQESLLERALARFGAAVAAKEGALNKAGVRTPVSAPL